MGTAAHTTTKVTLCRRAGFLLSFFMLSVFAQLHARLSDTYWDKTKRQTPTSTMVDCRPADAVMELTQLLHSSSHSTLKQLLPPLLLPCLNTIISSAPGLSPAVSSARSAGSHQGHTGPSTAADEFQTRGSAWVMLGMLRLHLAAPPGADPVGKYASKKAHLERRLAEDVLPETEVGSQEMLSHIYFIIRQC